MSSLRVLRLNNPARYFIADIHLADNEPASGHFGVLGGFLSFLDTLPEKCELYILGDLFDYWVGDDVRTNLNKKIAQALNALSQKQITKYFVHGNRDFLLGNKYAQLCDMTILSDISSLPNQDKNIILLHGDLLCIDDLQYQKFRNVMHNKWLQKLFLFLPFFIRLKIADKLRKKSSQHNQIKPQIIMDVNQQAVVEMMIKHNANIMVHGHTHKPANHHFFIEGKSVSRIVLGAWHDGISYIKQEQNSNQLKLYSHSFK
ncbi:UDP-2,3-diacylglucosamine diphosphatase [Gilliamella sp. wkB18]|jgi:UDP-2,3-diacylglucosamine hydrolase|uniref:UDP-2,3-diacylglucosamine diphosphatase n=1 Tax=unclassified Gilliamella TaxID=2685620 RepID=UPI00068BEB11|nr:UDP-2,3-diacylglucosamine diphosphatase [Gilliamella apicola]OCG54670.1 UDP-2,3-diacylglucosamine diphosphatase [Gilliamella apicola]OCG65131.1 UDP-2,3-diacylglucosamine diphosphatase [Gilliamella apicola]